MMWHDRPLRGVCLGLTALIGALALAVIVAGGAPEALLARSYAQSLKSVPTAWERRLSGNLWLSHDGGRGEGLSNVQPLRHALAIGDQIKISARAGTEETSEVTALEEFDGEGLGLLGQQLQMVTGKPRAGLPGETVRFLFAIDTPASTPAPAKTDRSL